MNFEGFSIGAFSKILDILYPRTCVFCSEILDFSDRNILCEKCSENINYIENYCAKCGKEISKLHEFCADCKVDFHFFNRGRSLFVYEDEFPNLYSLYLNFHLK